MIALIDYGSGNIRSVHNALQHEGADVQIVSTPARLDEARGIVLPGVGAFGDCVSGLRSRGFWEPLRDWLNAGKPFFGICVGYQLLFESSEETPGVAGLAHFGGKVKRFSTAGLKVPQIGWNQLEFTDANASLWRGLPRNPHVYFVHSYFPEPTDHTIVTAQTTYGETFAAAVARDNVFAVQFHPEKSQDVGLRILRNFVASIPLEKPDLVSTVHDK